MKGPAAFTGVSDMPSRPIQFLLVSAHPADSFDQAGGTLAHHVARGDRITVAVATTGVRSHHWKLRDAKIAGRDTSGFEQKAEKAVKEKIEEVRSACRIMGFDDVRDLGFDDDDILLTRDKVDAIADMIREVKPDVLIAHHPFETGGLKMHGTIGQATMYGWQVALGYGRGDQQPHRTSVVYFMGPINYIGNNSLEYGGTSRADLYVDITDVIDKKVKAIDLISSQYYSGAYARKVAETGNGHFGQHAGCAYAECFQRFRPMVRYTLPISDYDLDQVDEPMESVMCRRGEMAGAFVPMPADMRFDSDHRVSEAKYDG